LNENNRNLCNLFTKENNKRRAGVVGEDRRGLKCSWDLWNGEYMFQFGEHIRVVVHEYETAMKKSAQLSYWNLQAWWLPADARSFTADSAKNDAFELNLGEKASIKVGFMGYLTSGRDYFQMPLYLFYNQENRASHRFNYLNYLGAPIRLPSAIIDYFTLFYSNLWYI